MNNVYGTGAQKVDFIVKRRRYTEEDLVGNTGGEELEIAIAWARLMEIMGEGCTGFKVRSRQKEHLETQTGVCCRWWLSETTKR